MNMTIVGLTLRAILGRVRSLLLIPLPIILIGLTALGRIVNPGENDWQQPIVVGLGFAVIVPVVSLIIGNSVIGAEIDDGTVVYLLTKPLPRWQILLSKFAVAAGVSGLVNAAMMLVCGLIMGDLRLGLGLAVGALVASICYCAVFVLLSLVSRRSVLIGLVYILLWEGLLANLIAGIRSLSIEQYGVTIGARIGQVSYLMPTLSGVTAWVMAAVVAVLAIVVGINRLGSFSMRGETS